MWWNSSRIARGAIAWIIIGWIVFAARAGAVAGDNASTAQKGLSNTGSKCLSNDKMGLSH